MDLPTTTLAAPLLRCALALGHPCIQFLDTAFALCQLNDTFCAIQQQNATVKILSFYLAGLFRLQ